MIAYTIHNIPLPANTLTYIRGLTVLPYRPATRHIHTHGLTNWPEIELMEGKDVPEHDDDIDGYRPLLVLGNPSSNYIIRGTDQQLQPQRPGTLVVLDIGKKHQVHSIDPRFAPLYAENDRAWQNPTGIITSVLGKAHPPGYSTFIDDPDVDGLVIAPEHDYQDGTSSWMVFARTVETKKLQLLLKGNERVYLFDDMSLWVQRVFFVAHALLLVGVLEEEDA
ncbi:MAG: hypothetical protein ACFB2W_00765 [Leptolyngbyaceae cyanobacterium]